MSREIDMSDPSAWTEEDVQYLSDRGRLPADYPKPKVFDPAGPDLANTPNTGDVGTVPDDTRQPLTAADYAGAGLKALKAEAEARGLSSEGNKEALVNRLEEHDGEQTLGDEDDSDSDDETL